MKSQLPIYVEINFIRCITLVILIFIGHQSISQIEVSHAAGTLETVEDAWSLEINNPSSENLSVVIELNLNVNNRSIYAAKSNLHSLHTGLNILTHSLLNPIVSRQEDFISQSNYIIEIKLFDTQQNQVILTDRLRVDGLAPQDNINDEKRTNKIEYSGQASIYGQLSDMQGEGSFVPQNYVRAEIHPDMSFSGIPIGADILLSTEQNAFRQSINQVALRFDVQTFKSQMQQRLRSKVKEIDAIGDLSDIQDLNSLKEKAIAKKFPKLKEWEAQINDPQIQEGLQQIKQLESLDQILESTEVKEAILKQAKLSAKKQLTLEETNEAKRLHSFVVEIEKLQNKANELRQLSEKYKKYQDLNQKITQAKRFAERDLFKDPKFMKEGLKSLNLMSKPQEILNGFEEITIGVSYPYFSKFSLSSISINGINVEWNPGKFYISTVYGQSTRQTYNTNFTLPELTLPQTTFGLKIGYGSSNDSHIHFNFVDIEDKFSTLLTETDKTTQNNRIIGADGQLSLYENNIIIGAELQTSLFTRDKTITNDGVQEFNSSEIPINGLFGNINNSSSFDIAWRAYTDIKVFGNDTKVKASIEEVGANYYSLGSPVLLNDILRWKAEMTQSLFNNQIRATAFARREHNNINPLINSVESVTTSYGLNAMVNINKLPSLMLSYAPYAQNNNVVASNESFDTDSRLLNIIASYPIQLSKNISSNTQLTYLNQNLDSNIPGIDYSLHMYGLNQSLLLGRSSINISTTYTPNQIINEENKEILTLNFSGSIQLFSKWNNTLGFQYLTIQNQESRTGYYINSTYPITKFADLEIRLQRNIYDTQIDVNKNYRDVIMWCGLRVRW